MGDLFARPLSSESSCVIVVTVGIVCHVSLLFSSCLTVNLLAPMIPWLKRDFYEVACEYRWEKKKNAIGKDGPSLNPVHWYNFMGN